MECPFCGFLDFPENDLDNFEQMVCPRCGRFVSKIDSRNSTGLKVAKAVHSSNDGFSSVVATLDKTHTQQDIAPDDCRVVFSQSFSTHDGVAEKNDVKEAWGTMEGQELQGNDKMIPVEKYEQVLSQIHDLNLRMRRIVFFFIFIFVFVIVLPILFGLKMFLQDEMKTFTSSPDLRQESSHLKEMHRDYLELLPLLQNNASNLPSLETLEKQISMAENFINKYGRDEQFANSAEIIGVQLYLANRRTFREIILGMNNVNLSSDEKQ